MPAVPPGLLCLSVVFLQTIQRLSGCCRGVVHFDYVSGQGVSKNAPILDNGDLNALLWKKCNLSIEGEREQSLAPEKQMMRLRMLAPLLAVNSTQVSTRSVAIVFLNFGLVKSPICLFLNQLKVVCALLHL